MKYLTIVLLIFSPFFCKAEELVVEYSNFYSHTKKLQGDDTNVLQFAFGFKHVQKQVLCHVKSAFISTQKKDIALSITSEQRFVLPSEKVLKMAKAQVVIELEESANMCDMSVQLETKPEYLKTSYSAEELKLILKQYQAFFSDMGGLFSFMMPKAEGLSFHFVDNTPLLSLPVDLKLENKSLTLNADWIASNKGLQLNVAPLRVTALVVK